MTRLLALLLMFPTLASAWPERGPEGVLTGAQIDAAERFAPGQIPSKLTTDASALASVAATSAAWIRAHADDPAVGPALLGELGVTSQQVLHTLDLIGEIARADLRDGKGRLSDGAYLAARFDAWRWTPDQRAAEARGVKVTEDIRLTRYLVYEQPGALEKTDTFTHALYAAPDELSDSSPIRLRYTRQQVVAGVFEPGGEAHGLAKPLVWLTERGVYRALMQGTVSVQLSDGSARLFNVHRNNGIPYDRDIKDSAKQGRYWYFQPVDGLLGYGAEGTDRVVLTPGATVAGDVYNLGLGKLVALEMTDGVRLAVLADTGGAFQPNLYQLDFLTGTYPDYATFQKATQHIPERAGASVWIAKPGATVDAP